MPVGIADLRPRILLARSRAPHRLDALALQVFERARHVVDLEGHHPVAQMLGGRSGRHHRALEFDELHGRTTQIEIHDVQRRSRARTADPVLRANLEAEHLGVELNRSIELIGDDLDVIDSLEH